MQAARAPKFDARQKILQKQISKQTVSWNYTGIHNYDDISKHNLSDTQQSISYKQGFGIYFRYLYIYYLDFFANMTTSAMPIWN